MKHFRVLVVFAILVALCGTSCNGARQSNYHPQKFIGNEYSEARLIGGAFADKLEIDFTKMKKLEGITLQNTQYALTSDGLNIFPESADPIITFENPRMKYNVLELELQSSAGGYLEVYWSKEGGNFEESRKKRITIVQSDVFRKYPVNLWVELNPSLYGYKFRVDPIDKKATVTLKSITFYRMDYSLLCDPASANVQVGKVKIRNELREAFVMRPGSRVEKEVRVRKGDVLVFGLSKYKPNNVDGLFQVLLEHGRNKKELLFEKKLAVADEDEWHDYHLKLGNYAGRKGKLVLVMAPADTNKTAFVFCSNPMIVPEFKGSRKPNVILVSLDTLGARHLSLYGGPRNTDPFLKELAHEGVTFKNAFVNSSVTHISHGSMLTGLEPLRLNFLGFEGSLGNVTTLAQILRDNGYVTVAFTGGVLVSDKQEFDKGFESFYQEDTLYKDGERKTDIESLAAKTAKWIEDNPKAPFFLFLHTYEPHGPYYKHERYFKCDVRENPFIAKQESVYTMHMHGEDRLDPSEIREYVVFDTEEDTSKNPPVTLDDLKYIEDLYNSEIGFTDSQLQRLFENLRSKGLLDNSLLIITADHGEAFFEHNLLEHGLLYDENLRVPLILWSPKLLPSNRSVNEQASSIDIAPTILDILGITPQQPFDGHSLRPFIERKRGNVNHDFYSFVPENGFSWQVGNKYKFILHPSIHQENFGKKELFDLEKDPLEKTNLFQGMENLPGPLNKFVEDTVKSIPGIHIAFADFSDGKYEMKLQDAGKYMASVYGFNIDRFENHMTDAAGEFVCKVRLGNKSELVVMDNKVEEVRLTLKPPKSSKEFLFRIPAGKLGTQENHFGTSGTQKNLLAWRVNSQHESFQRKLSPDEERRLRSLGYIK